MLSRHFCTGLWQPSLPSWLHGRPDSLTAHGGPRAPAGLGPPLGQSAASTLGPVLRLLSQFPQEKSRGRNRSPPQNATRGQQKARRSASVKQLHSLLSVDASTRAQHVPSWRRPSGVGQVKQGSRLRTTRSVGGEPPSPARAT